ncbi:uncharacterized protein F4822DRAFT_425921 [Hypoxylon trugodes]|uniref:uncharacterized protein n=1 Tax=Hypoxylon trugodes TaxID=326681 RepID=UPI00218E803F|nr:uncharacterized protein F4822DRAFT_425921 [Hypoxylon trugodes]KAI1392716.1 hypothetical protein F4822DRAFT_425921 [Hypoxylon trugodes]
MVGRLGSEGAGWKSVLRAIASIPQFAFRLLPMVVENSAWRQHSATLHIHSLEVLGKKRLPACGQVAAVKRDTRKYNGHFRGQKWPSEGTDNYYKADVEGVIVALRAQRTQENKKQ